jgi:site-specific DNA recombinase
MTSAQIGEVVDALGGLLAVLTAADPAVKAEVYRQLGVRLTFDHRAQVVEAETQPQPTMGVLVVSEGSCTLTTRLALT